jgi:hypothetical protein
MELPTTLDSLKDLCFLAFLSLSAISVDLY